MTNYIITYPSCWKRKTFLEKLLWKMLFCLSMAIFAICFAQVFVIRHLTVTDNEKCSSKVCVKNSARLLNMMNAAVDPCDDFYDFACGNFVKHTVIPYSETSVDIIKQIKQNVEIELEDIVSSSVEKNNTSAFAKAQTFYNSCLNKTEFEKNGFKVLHTLLRMGGGWPMLEGEKWNEKIFDWIEAIRRWRQIGFYKKTFFRVYFLNSTRREFPKLVINPVNAIDRELPNQEIREFINYAKILGGNDKIIENDIRDLLTFINNIRQIKYNSTNVQLSVAELQEKYPNIRWLEYLKIRLKHFEKLDNNTQITLINPVGMGIYNRLFGQFSKRTIANYIIKKLLKHTIIYIPNDREIFKIYENPLQWQICLERMKQYFFGTTFSRYKNKFLIEENQKELHEIIDNIRTASIEMMKFAELVNSIGKEKLALNEEDLLSILDEIRYANITTKLPDEFLNDTFVDNIYKEIKVNKNVIFKTELDYTPPIIKSIFFRYFDEFVSPILDKIPKISPIFLRDPIFAIGRPASMNYGSIGFLIGERIISSTNNFVYINFTQQLQCLLDNYSNYTYPGTNTPVYINTTFEITKLRILFEYYGPRLAYAAYNKWIFQHGQDKELYGVNYNTKQLFWLSYAQQLCYKTRRIYKPKLFYDESIPKLQVLTSLRNSKEFAKDFHCPLGSYMNPKEKCS